MTTPSGSDAADLMRRQCEFTDYKKQAPPALFSANPPTLLYSLFTSSFIPISATTSGPLTIRDNGLQINRKDGSEGLC